MSELLVLTHLSWKLSQTGFSRLVVWRRHSNCWSQRIDFQNCPSYFLTSETKLCPMIFLILNIDNASSQGLLVSDTPVPCQHFLLKSTPRITFCLRMITMSTAQTPFLASATLPHLSLLIFRRAECLLLFLAAR